jgi:hypothetical protein
MCDAEGETDQALTHRLREGQHPQGRVLVLPQDLELLRLLPHPLAIALPLPVAVDIEIFGIEGQRRPRLVQRTRGI